MTTPSADVVKVGDGRGFIIEVQGSRYVVTAAHCLPKIPPAHPASYVGERTFKRLMGPLGMRSTVWAECVFVNPVMDLAVLASPDGQVLAAAADEYDALMGVVRPFPVARTSAQARGQMLTLKGQWFYCNVNCGGRSLWIDNPAEPIQGGMSGSPILTANGAAIGVVCTRDQNGGGPNPALFAELPAWLASPVRPARRGARSASKRPNVLPAPAGRQPSRPDRDRSAR
jgi:hypothetical protein